MCVAVLCAAIFGVPRVQINVDMTRYLPDSYQVKQGLDVLEAQLPDIGPLFADGNDLMPTGLPRTLAIGVGLLFAVLLVMCSSVMEVLLFLVTTVFAVVLNVGSNALLPSVSMMTNSLSSVLQMVLSMDYCIILMNRFREEKAGGKPKVEAMHSALRESASSILSSATTTIVSLLMLCFIRLKIGADLGVVLAKGVTLSLLCTFTVLPALILWGDRAVEATRKKVPRFPAAAMARFEIRRRYLLTVIFLLIFTGFAFLKSRTPISYSPSWQNNANKVASDNALLLLYPNAEASVLPALLARIGADTCVLHTVSYPSLMQVPRTARELMALSADTPLPFSREMLDLVYYAHAHPERTEMFSIKQLQAGVQSLSAQGLIPSGMALPSFAPKPSPVTAPVEMPEPTKSPASEPSASPVIGVADSLIMALPDSVCTPPRDTLPSSRFTYAQATTPLPAAEMAVLLGMNPKQVSMAYRMAGKHKGTMSPLELLAFVQEKILQDKRYAAFIPKGMAENAARLETELKAARMPDATQFASVEAPEDTLRIPADSAVIGILPEIKVADVASLAEEAAPDPMDELLEMALSSRRYSAGQVHRALRKAGFAVEREQLELLYLYLGAQHHPDSTLALSGENLLAYVTDTLLCNPALARFVPDSLKERIPQARDSLLGKIGALRGEDYSAAVILSSYPTESEATFAFTERLAALADDALEGPHYWVGESRMYKELKDGFPREQMLLTVLTILAIFLIVALTLHSLLIPIPLIMTILCGIFVNIWASGLGGHTLYYLSYLIIQGILMGATIDYSILFTHYYQEARRTLPLADAMETAYRGTSHSILTSGLILCIVPGLMPYTMDDPMIGSVLKSLSIGTFAILLLVLFLLPGVIAVLDPLLHSRKAAEK